MAAGNHDCVRLCRGVIAAFAERKAGPQIVMTLVEAFIAEFKRVQVVLRRQIALMENGMMRTEEKRGGQWINTTPHSIDNAERNLAEIERLLIQAEKRTSKPGLTRRR
jgi:hypothetical protein